MYQTNNLITKTNLRMQTGRVILPHGNMMKKMTLFALALVLGLSAATAQVRQNAFGVELGSHNTALYELTLGRHFSVTTRAGLVLDAGFSAKKDLDGKRFAFGGLTPFLSFEPRWYFSGQSSSDLFHTGGYLTVRLNGEWARMTILGPSYTKGDDRPLYTLSFAPTFGWTFGVSDNSYIRLSAGLGFFRTKVGYDAGKHYWRTSTKQGVITVPIEMVYGIRF